MSLLHSVLSRVSPDVAARVGDETLMQAAVSAAANVIVAGGEVSGEEVDTALVDLRANPILEKGYDTLTLEGELHDGVERAQTRMGRFDNLQRVAALAERPADQRQDVFLIAANVADQEGTSPVENKALSQIAEALAVDEADLLQRALARPVPSASAESGSSDHR